MKYNDTILQHFFNPKNVGIFHPDEKDVGRSVIGNRENGALIHFQVKIQRKVVTEARFKAYGSCPIIAACSYTTEWAKQKTLDEIAGFSDRDITAALNIPELKKHCALLVEDALKAAVLDYVENN